MEQPSNDVQTILPEKLIITPNTFTEEMDATEGWTVINGAFVLNSNQVHSGTGSLKVTSKDLLNYSAIQKSGNWDFSIDKGKSLQFWIYPHSDISTFNYIMIQAITDANNSFKCNYISTSNHPLIQNEWNMIWGGEFTAVGNPSWSNITQIKIIVYKDIGEISEYSLDLLSCGFVSKPAVLIMFDDGRESTYSKAYPLLKARNMVATCYIIANEIGNANCMTPSQLQELNAAGWDIANHTNSHPNLKTITQTEIEIELQSCEDYLGGLGLTRAVKHVAYPGGSYNATVLAAMSAWGAKTGRVLLIPLNRFGGEWYTLMCKSILYTDSFDDVTVNFNNLLGVPTILLHNLVDSNPAYGQWSVSDFSLLLDYIEALNLQTLTIDEYYRLNSGPITVNHK